MSLIRRLLSVDSIFFLLVSYILFKGWLNRENSFLTAESGLGYNIGIVGGSMMLILLLYPLRKHARFMRNWGPVRYWFQIHMMLGVAGPMLILFHSNFSMGSTNSNVALVSMLIVSSSGLLGRFFYTRIHDGLYGRKVELNELRESLMEIKSHVHEADKIEDDIKQYERAMLKGRPVLFALFMMPLLKFKTILIRSKIRRQLPRDSRKQIMQELKPYFELIHRVAEYTVYERLFSLWHILHIPLFIMLIISGTIHVIAVHIY